LHDEHDFHSHVNINTHMKAHKNSNPLDSYVLRLNELFVV